MQFPDPGGFSHLDLPSLLLGVVFDIRHVQIKRAAQMDAAVRHELRVVLLRTVNVDDAVRLTRLCRRVSAKEKDEISVIK